MRTRSAWLVAALALVATTTIAPSPGYSANPQVVVDLSTNTGSLRYGATGFLYGLANDGIPSDTMLAALRPQVLAQKAPGGLQHPDGDALQVAPEWKRTGGRDIQIYMQDIYQAWPYDNLGINDYLAKVDTMVRKVIADPSRSSYVYVPINEPDWIWYSGNLAGFENDWKLVYQKIRSIDPTARIAGPNYSAYNSADYRSFMTYAKNNNVLPDVTTWHELGDSFFSGWYTHYNDYRSIETSLGISPRPISINEYGRPQDLAVPGNLVQFVTRFENSKVDASLGYWTTSGALNDLVTHNNQATGAWWLYKWYGDLTGNTVTVTPPTPTGSLQGLAALDSAKRQARVIFGGSPSVNDIFSADIVVKGLASAPYLGSSVHATVLGVDGTGQNASPGPYIVAEGDYTASGGQVTVPLSGLKGSAAYEVLVTPNTDTSAANTTRYEAEYAQTAGTAAITYGSNTGYSGTYFVEGYGASSTATTKFVVTAPNNGYYNIGLRYSAGPFTGAPTNRTTRLGLNGSTVTNLSLPGTANWNTWNTVTTKVFLNAGINRIDVAAYTADDSDAINVDYIDVAATTGTVTSYEAESSANTRSGAAAVSANSSASGGSYVGWIGNGSANTLRFNGISAATAGRYRLVISYANGELGPGAANYNSNIVNRYADISVNGAAGSRLYFRNTLGWSNWWTTTADITLNAGTNTISFGNSSTGYAPDIDRIQIAAVIG